ncbi:MAG: efflux RND transporter periplasmic adaptor subunit [Pseudomonadota bacterium]
MSNAARKWLVLVGLAALIAVPIAMKLSRGTEAKSVDIEQVTRRVLSPTILASGSLTYQSEIKLVSEIIGRVKVINVKEGDQVKKGDVLLQLDPAQYLAEVSQLEAQLQQSRLNIDRQRVTTTTLDAKWKRYQTLRDQGVIDANTYEDIASQQQLAQVELSNSQQVLRQTEAQLKQARERLAKTELLAPLTGRVTALFIKTGETAVPSVTSIAGSDLMIVADTSSLYAEVNVNETDVARVGVGQEARIVAAAFPDKSWQGVVETVAVSPRQAAGQSKSYPVKIRLVQTGSLNFHTGMSCRAEISTRNTDAAATLAVPVQAVQYEDSTDKAIKTKASLFIIKDGRVAKRSVETGSADDAYIEITKGAQDGEDIVAGPARTLRFLHDGDHVVRGEMLAPAAPAASAAPQPAAR